MVEVTEIEEEVIKISYGMRFPPKTNYFAYLTLLLFIVAIATAPDFRGWYFVDGILVGILMVMITAINGVVIGQNKERFQYYFSVFGLTTGKWKKWKGYTCLVLKTSQKKRDKKLVASFVDVNARIERFVTTEVYLMDANHRRKILCGSFDSSKEAKTLAKKIAVKMKLPIQKFAPKRSANSINRRRRIT